eukprot:7684158-Pyramimonas_sp.AAC.1
MFKCDKIEDSGSARCPCGAGLAPPRASAWARLSRAQSEGRPDALAVGRLVLAHLNFNDTPRCRSDPIDPTQSELI